MRAHRPALLACAVVLAVSACGSGSSAGPGSTSSTTTTHTLDEHDNGHTVDVNFGDTIVVVLHSTYWTFAVPQTVLQPIGLPQPSPSSCGVTGGGCGTVTSTYNAGHVGETTLHAHRDSCGEAVRCTGSNADWSVTVRVS